MSKPYIRISYWPAERIYSTPNKLQASTPHWWDSRGDAAKEQWARGQVRQMQGRNAEYVGWEESDS